MRKVSAQCERITTRKEVHDLSPKEIEVYRSTIRQAMKTSDPYNPSLNMWEASAKFHEELAGLIHKGAEFFYWWDFIIRILIIWYRHRAFLYFVEKKLQTLNPEFAFPYWDSSKEFRNSEWSKSIALQISDVSDVLDTRRNLEPYDVTLPEQWTN